MYPTSPFAFAAARLSSRAAIIGTFFIAWRSSCCATNSSCVCLSSSPSYLPTAAVEPHEAGPIHASSQSLIIRTVRSTSISQINFCLFHINQPPVALHTQSQNPPLETSSCAGENAIKNEELCIENDEFVLKMMNFAAQAERLLVFLRSGGWLWPNLFRH